MRALKCIKMHVAQHRVMLMASCSNRNQTSGFVKIGNLRDRLRFSQDLLFWENFDVLLTVHLSIFNLSNEPTWCTKFLFYNKFISYLYMFRAHVRIIRRSKLHYTASGIITLIGGRLVHVTATYMCDDTRGCVMQFCPPHDAHMCSKHVEEWNKLIVKQNFCASSWLMTEINLLREV
jgi:hypothetical protein